MTLTGTPGCMSTTVQRGWLTHSPREPQLRPIIHHSRALTKAEQGYGKIEGESLAILAGIKSNSQYLYGTSFEVATDHQPLIPLYNNPKIEHLI